MTELYTIDGMPRLTVFRRFGCYCLDRLMGWAFVLFGVTAYSIARDIPFERFGGFYSRSLIEQIVLVIVLALFYGWCGQSPGKMVGYLKVARLDGGDVAWVQALTRAVFSHGIEIIPLWIYFTAKEQRASILLMSVLYLGLDGAFLLRDKEQRRALHDIVAGTKVVSLVRRASESGEAE